MKCLMLQIRGGVERDSHGKKAGKGALITEGRAPTLGVTQDATLFQMGGVCMSANLGESVRLGKRVCEEDSAVTLRASDGKMGDNQPVVAMSYDGYNQAGKEECCHTLGTCNSESPNNDKVVKVAIKCCPINSMILGKTKLESGDRQCLGFGEISAPCFTLQAAHHHAAAIKQSYGINPQGGQMLPFDKECGETLAIGHQGGVMTEQDISQMKYIVRRLTPVECERLMGLPDGWTIPRNLEVTDALAEEFCEKHDTFKRIMAEYENAPTPKPTSANQVRKWLEKITNPETCPDAPRYKACGNGWATNQPRWILTRLLAVEGVEW